MIAQIQGKLIEKNPTDLLIDCNDNEIGKVNIKNNITGKKISSVEVLVRVASDTQNQN